QGAWDFVSGASESETTQRRNRLAFDRIAFRPRVLRDVSHVDTSTEFLGESLRIPVMLAPVGGLQNFTPEGAAASTKAAAEFGIMHVLSSVTEPTLEDTASAVDYPKMFQLYLHGDWEWTVGQIARIKEAGFKALCITVDTASYSRRERPLLGRTTPVTVRDPSARSHQASVTWETIDRIKDEAGLPLMLKGIATAEDAAIATEHGIDVVWVS
ncbi:MAG TPA: alpha-hydroxy-acid oxidizing enzyme, partial [Dehalococcoidia bacterium]|nr:alpha-hydroxy-acid oxidizing enzyme [Dehalococcoidia bacterium]